MADDVDREKLYGEVWATPLTTLCKSYGMSYAGMKRLCSGLNVPVPQRGHWARVAAGQAFTKPELPDRDAVQQAALTQPRANVQRKPQQPEPIPAESAPEQQPEKPLHRVIQPLQHLYCEAEKQALKGKEEFDWEQAHPGKRYPKTGSLIRFFSWEWFCQKGEILRPSSKKAVLKVSIRTYKRALQLLSTLAFALEAAGFIVKLTEKDERLEASRAGAVVLIRISEKLEAGYKTVTNSWDGSPRQERVLSPTEILSIYVEQQGYGEIRFSDSKSGLLEGQWQLIVEGVERQHASSVRWLAHLAEDRRVSREQERLRLLEAQRQADIRAREEAEAKQRLELAQEAERWISAERIREYVSRLEVDAAAGGLNGTEVTEWLAWAREAADQLDPSITRLRSWQIKPEAGDVD